MIDARTLTLEQVELDGATRTTLGTVFRFLDVEPGDPVTQDGLWLAVDRLRRSDLFTTVDYYTKAGTERGHLVLVLEVEERGPEFHLGTGNSNMDGWYIIPAELNLDNWGGDGEQAGVRFRAGYRLFDFGLYYGRGGAPSDRVSWSTDLTTGVHEHVYFREGVEYAHPVVRSGAGLAAERRLTDGWLVGAGVRFESVYVDSVGYVRRTEEWADVQQGDEVPYEDLPAGVAAMVGRHGTATLRFDLVRDGLADARWADSPVSGFWGRLRLKRVEREIGAHGGVELDLRGYRPLGSGVLAVRGRAVAVGDAAPFHDRLYLGGLYTVRGFPGHSLSPAEGDTRLWHASAEYRLPLYGDPRRPRLAGLLFVDAGRAGDDGRETSAAAGWGFRIRLGWLGWLGTDIAFPLTDSPADEGFHGHASLGWSF